MTAFLFWQFGVRKFFGWLGGRPVPFPQLRWFAGVLESFGSPLIALGAFTRPLAFLLSGEMATAYWTSHFPRGPGFWPIQNGGEASTLFCFIYLFLVTAGPGKLSLDGLLSKRSG
ncbi:MAG: DoxX family protein [Acidobacteria bacterium]|nr:DoxX family protein [Acidobacteriota bacterium]